MSRASEFLEKLSDKDRHDTQHHVRNWQEGGAGSEQKAVTKIAANTIHDPDAARKFHPGKKSMKVYRGSSGDGYNKRATSWSTSKKVAKKFAKDNTDWDDNNKKIKGKVTSFKVDKHTPAIDVNKTLGKHADGYYKKEKEVILPDFSRPDKHPELVAHTSHPKSLGSISHPKKEKTAEPFLDYDESLRGNIEMSRATTFLEKFTGRDKDLISNWSGGSAKRGTVGKMTARTIDHGDLAKYHPSKTMTVYRGTSKGSTDFNKETTSWSKSKEEAQGFADSHSGYDSDLNKGAGGTLRGGKVISFKVDKNTPAIDVNKTPGHSTSTSGEKEVILPNFSDPAHHPEQIAHTSHPKSLGSITHNKKDKPAEPFLDYDESLSRAAKFLSIYEGKKRVASVATLWRKARYGRLGRKIRKHADTVVAKTTKDIKDTFDKHKDGVGK